ncbi:MAG: GatB/YqeY domain-containing protein [Elstera sp.]
MSSLRAAIADAYKTAMLERDKVTVGAMRLIQSALKDRDIAARPKSGDAIPDAEILSMLQTMVKQRRESITMYEQGGRQELAEAEAAEIAVIERFLPKPMSADEADAAIAAVIAELGASGIKDMGRVIGELKTRFAGAMDFQAASAQVKAKLTA